LAEQGRCVSDQEASAVADVPVEERRPTMGDVAARAGVSRQLVSLVLRDAPGASAQTRARVRQAADDLGYSPDIAAQMLRRKGTRTLGVLFTLEHDSEAAIVEQMHVFAAERGYSLILGARSPSRTETTAVQELVGYRCDALILISSTLPAAALRQLAQRVPLVIVGNGSSRYGCDVVRSAGDHGIAQAVAHLADLGHRRISYLHGRSMPTGTQRRQGYLTAMTQRNLTPDIIDAKGDYIEEAGARAAAELLRRPTLPTAVVANNDHAALGLLVSLVRAGVPVPGQVSVTGYDDSRIAGLSFVDLTSVRQDPAEMGDLAVDCAITRITGQRQHALERVTSAELVVRGSTGPVRR
jgi:DNA-binding LacI/PurR family transcriptional regulator